MPSTPLPKCTLNGRHSPGSEWSRVCPLNPERVAAREHEKERRHQAERVVAQKAAP